MSGRRGYGGEGERGRGRRAGKSVGGVGEKGKAEPSLGGLCMVISSEGTKASGSG